MEALPHGNDNQPSGTFSDEAIRPLIVIDAGQHLRARPESTAAESISYSVHRMSALQRVGALRAEPRLRFGERPLAKGRTTSPA